MVHGFNELFRGMSKHLTTSQFPGAAAIRPAHRREWTVSVGFRAIRSRRLRLGARLDFFYNDLVVVFEVLWGLKPLGWRQHPSRLALQVPNFQFPLWEATRLQGATGDMGGVETHWDDLVMKHRNA